MGGGRSGFWPYDGDHRSLSTSIPATQMAGDMTSSDSETIRADGNRPPAHSAGPEHTHAGGKRSGRIGSWIGWLILGLGIVALVFVMARSGRVRPPGPPRVVVSVPPLVWPVQRLAPDGTEITMLVTPGASEHGIELTPSQVRAIVDADLVVMVGMGLDTPVQQVLDRHGADWRRIVRFEDVVAEHAEASDIAMHDPHVWLDPVLYRAFVEQIAEVTRDEEWIFATLPDGERSERLEMLLGTIDSIHKEYVGGLRHLDERRIVTHHAAWGHLARRYGLEMSAVIRPRELIEPTAGDLSNAIEAVNALDVRTIFIEPQFHDAASRRIADVTGARVLVIDPLGDGDWPGMMRANLAAFIEGLRGGERGVRPTSGGESGGGP